MRIREVPTKPRCAVSVLQRNELQDRCPDKLRPPQLGQPAQCLHRCESAPSPATRGTPAEDRDHRTRAAEERDWRSRSLVARAFCLPKPACPGLTSVSASEISPS